MQSVLSFNKHLTIKLWDYQINTILVVELIREGPQKLSISVSIFYNLFTFNFCINHHFAFYHHSEYRPALKNLLQKITRFSELHHVFRDSNSDSCVTLKSCIIFVLWYTHLVKWTNQTYVGELWKKIWT